MLGLGRAPSFLALVFALSLAPCDVTIADEVPDDDETLSPYFFVEGGDPAIDRFPLASTDVDVAITGPIASVTVRQVYENRGARPIHARYVFPASTRAAVNGLRMALAGRVIEAEIQERGRAQRTFAAAQREGKTATLLEQQRPNVFTMRVANVLPGDSLEVTLRYTELLVPRDGRYELVFPTVVGPRYANATDAREGRSGFVAAPYLHAGAPPPAPLHIHGTVAAGLPILAVESATHALTGALDARGIYRFALDDGAAERAGNRDFVLGFRLAGDAVQTGLALFDAGDEKFFLLLAMPPARVAADEVPPREFVFVLDVSGSMMGFPLETAKALLRKLVLGLRPSDRFDVLTFSGGSRLLAPRSLQATPENVAFALAAIDEQEGGGGTELLPALERALALTPEPGIARSFVVKIGRAHV
jgi:Ca-activated chloride channel family protein